MTLPIEKEAIFPRLDGIRKNIAKLRELAKIPFNQFKTGDPFDLAQHHLRLALEGVFNIATHLLSRIPGGRAVEYKEIARKMGQSGLVPAEFAERALVPMAGLRNFLVHAYADINPKKLYEILNQHLNDVEFYLEQIKNILEAPEKFGFEMN